MKRLIIACLLFLPVMNACFSAEWQKLHEEADKISGSQAKSLAEKSPMASSDLYIYGLVNLNIRNDKTAKEIFLKIKDLDVSFYEADWGLAEVLRRGHKIEESESMLLDLIKRHPDFAPPYLSLAYIRYNQMKFEESVRLAHKVTAMGEKNLDLSNYVRAYLIIAGAKGMIAHYGGPLSKAINGTQVLPILKKVQNIRPESPELLFGLGSFYLLAPKLAGGDLNSAGEYLKKTIEADPLFVDAYVRLAQFYKLKGDKEKYDFYINKAGEIDPQNELFLDIAKGRCNFICVE